VAIVAYKGLWLFVDRICSLRTVQCGIEISVNNCYRGTDKSLARPER